ncbi:Helix-turn-helix domain-containing protein [Lentzea xinjiangensis]|uniref:Helix-turn-helix domain-containing protein n=1 Tax=Lentzea xinjiangensis TaxID=402600 RepID=A0A1H9RYF7_9PSEU|nr:helix-turn-helix transcriptional regulator [Lentzea xinjiangensis]SER77678.1 Helix-turn-helix domain-containing protein [Lentzea xinjiangensis]
MKLIDKVSADGRLTWERKAGVVLTVMLECVGAELELARVLELAQLDGQDVINQLRRFVKAGVLSRRTDQEVFPASDFFHLPVEKADRARLKVQLVDDDVLRELTAERGLDVDRALGLYPERQPYEVALGKALRAARNELGWSLEDVAMKVRSVTSEALCRYEHGDGVPTLITVAELAQAYDADPSDLVVHAAYHSKVDPRVHSLRVADPVLRAVLAHAFARRTKAELQRTRSRRTQVA